MVKIRYNTQDKLLARLQKRKREIMDPRVINDNWKGKVTREIEEFLGSVDITNQEVADILEITANQLRHAKKSAQGSETVFAKLHYHCGVLSADPTKLPDRIKKTPTGEYYESRRWDQATYASFKVKEGAPRFVTTEEVQVGEQPKDMVAEALDVLVDEISRRISNLISTGPATAPSDEQVVAMAHELINRYSFRSTPELRDRFINDHREMLTTIYNQLSALLKSDRTTREQRLAMLNNLSQFNK